jgi:hypothetical protein
MAAIVIMKRDRERDRGIGERGGHGRRERRGRRAAVE